MTIALSILLIAALIFIPHVAPIVAAAPINAFLAEDDRDV